MFTLLRRTSRLCLLIASCFAGVEAVAAAPYFPVLEADDLNGRQVTLPGDFPGDPTLVFIAFKQSQQPQVDAWVQSLRLAERPDIAWVELPTINRAFRLVKGYIDNGMQSGITATEARARTISIYGQNALMQPLGVATRNAVIALVAKRDGEVLIMTSGDPTPTNIKAIGTALGVDFNETPTE